MLWIVALSLTLTPEEALRKAGAFYANQVARGGGYQARYTDDLSYARSEHGDGLEQIETQRDATPRVAMAFLEAHAATGDQLFLDAARQAALALVSGQLCSGGWDYTIELNPAKRQQHPYRVNNRCAQASKSPPTTLDDNVTQACIRVLARTDRALAFQDQAIHEAALFALDSLLKAQYPNGAWPQRYSNFPDPNQHQPKQASYPKTWSRQWPGENYKGHYTFNDNSLADVIDTLLECARIYKDGRYRQAAIRGGEFILRAQMPEPQPAWAQQYDANMQPAWARIFEPPSITGGESQGIIQMLFILYRETNDRRFFNATGPALAWLEKSVVPRPANPSEIWQRVNANEPTLARFYELQTNRPLFITKGTQIQGRGIGSARIDGYEVTYSDASVINHYGVLTSGARLKQLRQEHDALAANTKPQPRAEILHGLSPWQENQRPRKPDPKRLTAIISAMDERGAWIEDGVIGKEDKVMSVFAARPMMLTINGRPIEIKENDRIELFQGAQPPRQKILRSTTFATNLETLAAAVAKPK